MAHDDDNPLRDVNSILLGLVQDRMQKHADIINEHSPTMATTGELLAGYPFYRNTWQWDLQAWASRHLQYILPDQLEGDEFVFLKTARCLGHQRLPDLSMIVDRLEEEDFGDETVRTRLEIYDAYATGNGKRLLPMLLTGDYDRQMVLLGWSRDRRRTPDTPDAARRDGMVIASYYGPRAKEWIVVKQAREMSEVNDKVEETLSDEAAFLQAVIEDRAEYYVPKDMPIEQRIWSIENRKQKPPGLQVVPKLSTSGATGPKKDIIRSWVGKDGVKLPLVLKGDLAGKRAALVAERPWCVEVIDTLLMDLVSREDVRFRPTLLVGPQGFGKSSLARAIADEFRQPSMLVSFAGTADSAAMGTSAQYSSARENAVLQCIKANGVPNPMMIWDEVEKAKDSHNGNAMDGLLPMLEPDQAKRYRDLALEVEVDLSAVSHIATANSLEKLSGPLRDRFRIIRMPEPGWQDLGVLTKRIVDRICQEDRVDPRFVEALAEDELDLIRKAWPGGSIRQLTAIVRRILAGRNAFYGRAN